MTVKELLELAENLILVAGANAQNDQYEAAQVAATTAQAAAATAQAMMLAQMTSTGENVTTGETVRWLRVDTGN